MALIKTNPVYFPGEEREGRAKKVRETATAPKLSVTKKGKVEPIPKERKLVITNNKKELERIKSIVCLMWNVEEKDIATSSRKMEIKTARHLIMFFGHTLANCSYHFIGDFLNRDHSTVIHGVATVKDLLSFDYTFRLQVREIENKIKRVPSADEKIMQYNFEVFKESQNEQ